MKSWKLFQPMLFILNVLVIGNASSFLFEIVVKQSRKAVWITKSRSTDMTLLRQSPALFRLAATNDNDTSSETISSSLLGGIGSLAAGLVLFSEYTLKTTGCGLPAGPGGAVGALEGLSYLSVVGIAGYSLYVKAKTGSGLPGVLLGAAEGLSFLAIFVGLVVLGFQVADYGYIPNAVPSEGSICK